MPSPVGHALGGIAAGWLVQPAGSSSGEHGIRATVTFAALAVAPDLDLLVGRHRGPTHSLGATLLVGVLAWLVLRRHSAAAARLALACAAAYGSHVLLDLCGADTSLPYGLTALWPFSSAYYEGPWRIFLAVSRRYRQPDLFWLPNILAVVREVLILTPVVALVAYSRRRRGSARRLLACLVLATAACATTVAAAPVPAQTPGSERYAAAVSSYCAGRFEDAVRAATDMSEELIRNALKDLRKDVRTQQCAVMLHTEVAFSLPVRGPTTAWQFHVAQARQQLAELRRMRESSEFERQWYLFVSSALQADQELEQVHTHLVLARDRFPRDADVLVSSGAEYELYALSSSAVPRAVQGSRNFVVRSYEPQQDRKEALDGAFRFLTAAVAAAPDHDEARVRLGRVLFLQGHYAQAIEHLDVARGRAQDDGLRYLAATFEAAAEKGLGRTDRAATLYAQALKIFRGQSASVGLSDLYYESGRFAEAAATLMTGLVGQAVDPWFTYSRGDSWRKASRLEALRRMATQ